MIGIDDWAQRKGHRYCTVICDLERRVVVDLLPDRKPATVAAWLARMPTIQIIARTRGGGYGAAATKALPAAIQLADRWHLMENASAAFICAIRRHMREIRRAAGTQQPRERGGQRAISLRRARRADPRPTGGPPGRARRRQGRNGIRAGREGRRRDARPLAMDQRKDEGTDMSKRPSIIADLKLDEPAAPATPAAEAPAPAKPARKPRPDIVHTSIYLPKAVHRKLREVAFTTDRKVHDVILEGIDAALRKYGHEGVQR